jgi:hypothetical protein
MRDRGDFGSSRLSGVSGCLVRRTRESRQTRALDRPRGVGDRKDMTIDCLGIERTSAGSVEDALLARGENAG